MPILREEVLDGKKTVVLDCTKTKMEERFLDAVMVAQTMVEMGYLAEDGKWKRMKADDWARVAKKVSLPPKILKQRVYQQRASGRIPFYLRYIRDHGGMPKADKSAGKGKRKIGDRIYDDLLKMGLVRDGQLTVTQMEVARMLKAKGDYDQGVEGLQSRVSSVVRKRGILSLNVSYKTPARERPAPVEKPTESPYRAILEEHLRRKEYELRCLLDECVRKHCEVEAVKRLVAGHDTVTTDKI